MTEKIRFCPYCGGDLEIVIVPTGEGGALEGRSLPTLHVEPEALLGALAGYLSVRVDLIRGPSRARYLVDCRRVVARQLRRIDLSLAEVGRLLGDRNHTTVLNLVNTDNPKVEARLARAFPTVDEFVSNLLAGAGETAAPSVSAGTVNNDTGSQEEDTS